MISTLIGLLIFSAGGFLVAVAGVLAWDDARARARDVRGAYRWEDEL